MKPAFWVVCADGPRAARWQRLWAAVGAVPRRAARLDEVPKAKGLALTDLMSLRPDPARLLSTLRAKNPGLVVLACAFEGSPAELDAAALAGGALDLFREESDDESLAARLAAHLKRLFPRRAPAGRLRVEPRSREVRVRRGKAWRAVAGLTAREFDLLAVLASAEGRALTREELLAALGIDAGPDAVDRAAGGARRKLGAAGRALENVRGVGYRLDNA